MKICLASSVRWATWVHDWGQRLAKVFLKLNRVEVLTSTLFFTSRVSIQAFVQFYPQLYSGPRPRRLVAQTASATETSTNKPTMAAFSAGVVLMAMVLMATAGIKPAINIGFRMGC